jgi:hypothetical protein
MAFTLGTLQASDAPRLVVVDNWFADVKARLGK